MSRWLAVALIMPALCWAQNELNSESGLVGRWLVPGWQTGNGAAPTKTLDVSGNYNTGSTSNSQTWMINNGRQSLLFNGTNQYVVVTTSSLLKVGQKLSISVWTFANSYPKAANYVIAKANYDTDYYGYELWVGSGSNVYFYIGSSSSGSYLIGTNKTLTANQWHHICAVANGSNNTQEIWIDGVLKESKTQTQIPNYAQDYNLGIGVCWGNAGWKADRSWNGKLSDVRLYNRSLSAAEIKSIYEQGLAPK